MLLCGFGSVNKALLKMLVDKRTELRREHCIDFIIAGIITGSHGYIVARTREGIDPLKALQCGESGGSVETLVDPTEQGSFEAGGTVDDAIIERAIRWSNADVMFEAIPVDYQTGQPATRYIQQALTCGMHAISANKGPVVHAHQELQALATRHGVRYRYEY
jgi:homoserine dehydrogenase